MIHSAGGRRVWMKYLVKRLTTLFSLACSLVSFLAWDTSTIDALGPGCSRGWRLRIAGHGTRGAPVTYWSLSIRKQGLSRFKYNVWIIPNGLDLTKWVLGIKERKYMLYLENIDVLLWKICNMCIGFTVDVLPFCASIYITRWIPVGLRP